MRGRQLVAALLAGAGTITTLGVLPEPWSQAAAVGIAVISGLYVAPRAPETSPGMQVPAEPWWVSTPDRPCPLCGCTGGHDTPPAAGAGHGAT